MSPQDNHIQIEKFKFHKSLFGIGDSPHLSLFSQFIEEEKNPFSLECSCKISSDEIYPARFNIWYKDKTLFHKNILSIVSFFRRFKDSGDFLIDKDKLSSIIHNMNYQKTMQIIIGVDFRDNINESRLKLWFIVRDDQNLIEDTLKDYSPDIQEQLKHCMISNELLFGFDFYPSGKISTKIYPLYSEKDIPILIDRKLMPQSDRINELIRLSSSFHISFKSSVADKIYHLRPIDETAFLMKLKNKRISSIYDKISSFSGRNKLIVSLDEKEIISGNILSANIYY